MPQLTLTERRNGDVTVLDAAGKIVIGDGSVQLRDRVRDLISSGHYKILLNLGAISYVDSSGIGELVSSYTTVNNVGGQLKLVNLNRKIQDLLMITKLLTVFETYDDEEEAVKSFR
ncbi:STAS domain-containing protein [Microtetraspora sp. NBRC 16547]|uniref:STAS domain-containing protein n=1 Tax=Microtetraspora sp. NBRC 16547 TaxID=3030993 RepID=UPI0024A0A6A2|nr:STAS domain-containing protein [Microtetraspora sp. NBRC 16547]GLX00521.1 anti-sigma factor antagonist [Microtetraspora sp. NBRC 16547]